MERMERVNQTMRKEIAEIIRREVSDPRLSFISINRVEVSRDLQHAKVFFSVLGDKAQAEAAQSGLDHARGFIRRLVAQRVRLKFTPELNFFYDKSLEDSLRIEEELERIKHDTTQNS